MFDEVSIPMRDGQALSAWVRHPTAPGCQLPTVLVQTPYNKDAFKEEFLTPEAGSDPLFASTDYVFVVMDWRGFFGSAGAKPGSSHGADGYDAVEWIAQQAWSDGNVGTWGVSALCEVQYWTAVLRPPHLRAGVPIFCDMNEEYSNIYPGGVMRQDYVTFVSSYYGTSAFQTNPYDDAAWTAAGAAYNPGNIAVPMLVVAGWYDLMPKGSFTTFAALVQSSDPSVSREHRLLIGPWIHFAIGGEVAGEVTLTSQELQYTDQQQVVDTDSLAWFDLYLRNRSDSAATAWAAVQYERAGAETGTWLSDTQWPPAGGQPLVLSLSTGGTLAASPPTSPTTLALADDPLNPSPTIGGPTLLPSLIHGPADQAPVLARQDARPSPRRHCPPFAFGAAWPSRSTSARPGSTPT